MKVVYKHLRSDTKEVFYIGMGKLSRAYDMSAWRNSEWNHMYLRYGCDVEIVKDGLTKESAWELEIELIAKYGRLVDGSGTLVNIMPGGSVWNREDVRKLTSNLKNRIIYKRMKLDIDSIIVCHPTKSELHAAEMEERKNKRVIKLELQCIERERLQQIREKRRNEKIQKRIIQKEIGKKHRAKLRNSLSSEMMKKVKEQRRILDEKFPK